jgi:hypothetical protein
MRRSQTALRRFTEVQSQKLADFRRAKTAANNSQSCCGTNVKTEENFINPSICASRRHIGVRVENAELQPVMQSRSQGLLKAGNLHF